MKIYKIFIFTVIILTFLLTDNVYANYEATVLITDSKTCELDDTISTSSKYYKNSTGPCVYANANLNSLSSKLYWLDTGDEVTIDTSVPIISSNSNCSGNYVYINYSSLNSSGYYCNTYLKTSSILTDELKNKFRTAGFPENYWEKLAILTAAHPNWIFKAINTGLDFNTVVENQNYGTKSLIQSSSYNNYANNYGYLALDYGAFDYINDKFIAYDGSTWFRANKDTIAYYLDPRNFLIDMNIFEFQALSYDNTLTEEDTLSSIQSMLNNNYLHKFSNDFVTAGKESGVSPLYLASLSKQEVGGESATTAITGEYNGMYNFYNIGATAGEGAVYRGLDFAAGSDESVLRPWNTEYKAIVGGAKWISQKYISFGQDTSYFKKFNVVHDYLISSGRVSNPYGNYDHQYMQNIMAPSSEAYSVYIGNNSAGVLNSAFTFYIPVFNNMPTNTSLSTKSGWPNNYLKSLIINDTAVAGFSGDIINYNYNLDINNPTVTLSASSVSSLAKVEGTGTYTLEEDTTKVITVTAENGDIKTYNINITLTGTKLEDPIDVQKTLNNSGIKNGEKYLSGFTVGQDISFIKDKINNANSNATVILKNSNGDIKTSGVMSTGDKVTITVGNETKDYEVVIYGDVSGDGVIDALDFIRIKKYMLGQLSLSGYKLESADISKDGIVDALDFIRIKKYMLGSFSSIIQ